MHTIRLTRLLTFLLLLLLCPAIGRGESATDWLTAKTGVFEDNEYVGIRNESAGLLIHKERQAIVSLWSKQTGNLIAPKPAVTWPAVWSLDTANRENHDIAKLSIAHGQKVTYRATTDDDRTELSMSIDNVRFKTGSCRVTLIFTLLPDAHRFTCTAAVQVTDGEIGVWELEFPRLLIGADENSSGNRVLIPYRRGKLMSFDDDMPRYKIFQPYPSASAHFQFMASFNETSQRGLYLATEDSSAYLKTFHQDHQPRDRGIILSISHRVEDRGNLPKQFKQPYDTILEPFHGNWWHACRIYREWWVKQQWASKGLIQNREDIPDWLKYAPAVARMSTSRADRTVARNLNGAMELSEAVGGRPLFGIWYAPFDKKQAASGTGLDQSGHGHHLPPYEGVTQALDQMRSTKVYAQAYLQSKLYQTDLNTPQANAERSTAQKNAIHKRDGSVAIYHYAENLMEMCQATEWWQQRVEELAASAVKMGFSGIYLDSFGRGSVECFSADHPHAVGGGIVITQSQRQLAQRVLTAIRKVNPDAILSGEAPVETYRDILHVNLYAVNVIKDYAPAFRAIWGDYSLGHGRTARLSKTGDNLVPEMTTLFLEGTILGRFFCSSEQHFFNDPKYQPDWQFVQKLMRFGELSMQHVRFGEYLQPLRFDQTSPTVSYTEGVLNRKVESPALQHSVTRSHTDGSVGIVLVNASAASLSVSVPIDPALRSETLQQANPLAMLTRMNETGQVTKLSDGTRQWQQSLTLAPREIAYLILK